MTRITLKEAQDICKKCDNRTEKLLIGCKLGGPLSPQCLIFNKKDVENNPEESSGQRIEEIKEENSMN